MGQADGERKSQSDAARERAEWRDTLPAVALLLVTQGSLLVLDPDAGASAGNLAWSLLPVAPALWLMWAQVRSLRRADEYQRVQQLEALAIGFAAMILVALVGGLLDAAGSGDAGQSLQVTFIVGILAWVGARAVKTGAGR